LEPVFIVTGFWLLVGWVVTTLAEAKGRRDHVNAVKEFQSRLLDRTTTLPELTALLETKAGQQMLAFRPANPLFATRVIRALQTGIVLTALGAGLFLAGDFVHNNGREEVKVFAMVILSLGVGFLVSSVASFVLAQRLGLMEKGRAESASAPAI